MSSIKNAIIPIILSGLTIYISVLSLIVFDSNNEYYNAYILFAILYICLSLISSIIQHHTGEGSNNLILIYRVVILSWIALIAWLFPPSDISWISSIMDSPITHIALISLHIIFILLAFNDENYMEKLPGILLVSLSAIGGIIRAISNVILLPIKILGWIGRFIIKNVGSVYESLVIYVLPISLSSIVIGISLSHKSITGQDYYLVMAFIGIFVLALIILKYSLMDVYSGKGITVTIGVTSVISIVITIAYLGLVGGTGVPLINKTVENNILVACFTGLAICVIAPAGFGPIRFNMPDYKWFKSRAKKNKAVITKNNHVLFDSDPTIEDVMKLDTESKIKFLGIKL